MVCLCLISSNNGPPRINYDWWTVYGNGTIYCTINLTTHHYGIHNTGGPPKATPPPVAASIMVDGEIYGAIYGTIPINGPSSKIYAWWQLLMVRGVRRPLPPCATFSVHNYLICDSFVYNLSPKSQTTVKQIKGRVISEKKGPCQEACTPSSEFWSKIDFPESRVWI